MSPDIPVPAFHEVLEESTLADNSMEIVKIDGRRIAVIRRFGKLFAIDNDCPHVGGFLGRGTLDGSNVVCPLHQWTFDIATGKSTKGLSDMRVAVHEVKAENGKIWVKLT